MTLNNLVEDILKSIVDAQHDAYVHSQKIGEQNSESLFPVPIAEIREIVLDLKYAYEKPVAATGAVSDYETLPTNAYDKLESIYNDAFIKARKAMIDCIDLSTASASQEWIMMKSNLLRGKLDNYVMSEFKKNFLNGRNDLITDNSFENRAAQELLLKTIQDTIINHPDLKAITEQVNPLPAIKEALSDSLNRQVHHINQQLEQARTKVPETHNRTEIIVDASELGKLQEYAIHHAKIVLDVKSDLNNIS